MGFLDNKASKAHQRQQAAVIAEATSAGLVLLEQHELSGEDLARRAVVSTALKAFIGGRLAPDTLQIFVFGAGDRRGIYVQPYSGLTPLPGEHIVALPGTLPAPAALTDEAIFGGPSWQTGPDKVLAKRLNKGSPGLRSVAKRTRFEWATGLTKIRLAWAVQVVSMGDGRSLVAMQTGRYGGITTYGVGFAQLASLCQALGPILDGGTAPPQRPLHPIHHQELFLEHALGIKPVSHDDFDAPDHEAPTDPGLEPVDRAAVIQSLVQPHESGRLHSRSIPPKKLRNVRASVLPPAARDADVVLILDLTTFGSAKDAVVLTPTQLYCKEFGERVDFALSELQTVHGVQGALADKVRVTLRGRGEVVIPCAGEGAGLVAVLEGLVG